MKTKLFLVGLLSYFYVNSQVVSLGELSIPDVGIVSVLSTIFNDSGATTMEAAPTNDECEGAIALTVNADNSCAVVTTGTLAEATDSGFEAEAGTADDDVWFSFVATNSSHKVTLEVEDDVVIEVMSGNCEGLEIVEYIDYPNVLNVTELEVGTTYYVRVYSYTDTPQDTTFEICIGTPPAAPANDDCENAVALTVNPDYLCGTIASATLESATDSGIEAEVGTADDDVWFSFTATSETHKIVVSNIESSGWEGEDLAIEVFSNGCGGTSVDASDPNTVIVSGLSPESVYYVRVYSYYDYIVDTTFDICIGTPPPAPANDECAAAVALTVSATSSCAIGTPGTLQSASDSGVTSELGVAEDDVWYSFVATSTSHLITLENVEGDTTNLVFEVLEGICDEQNSVQAMNADIGIVYDLTIGTTYYLRVFTFDENANSDTVFDICVATPAPAPTNDECDAAIVLTVNATLNCGTVTAGTLESATDSGIPDETGTADDDVWYSFTATADTHKISLLNIEGNNEDLVIEVFEGECGGELIESSDPQSTFVSELVAGTVYYVRVFSYGTQLVNTTFDICIGTVPMSQPNDECEDAIALTVNTNGICEVVTTASLASATDSGIEAEEGTPNDDVWFSFVATGTSHKVAITDSDDFNTLLVEVFEGACGELNLISDPESIYINDLTIGSTYYVRVFSYSADPVFTIFDICVTQRQDPPANDECDGAISLTVDAAYCNGVLTNGNNLGATASELEVPECLDEAENDVWFSFTVPANVATVDISTDFAGGTIEDSTIALYTGTCDDLTEIGCNDDAGEENLSIITNVAVVVGQTYYVRVSGYDSDNEGTFCLEVTTNETLSAEDFTKNTLKAYPNPVKNILNLSNTTTITDVAIFNLVGQQVMAKTVNANQDQVDMSSLSAGAYLVKVTAENAVQTIKVIKE